MSRFLKKSLSSLEQYVPGEQPQDKKYIKLNTNESPYPPSPAAAAAIGTEQLESLRLYCDPRCGSLKQAIADELGVKCENVFVSNGSDEALSFFFMGFCSEDRGVAFPDISYGFYKVFAELYGIKYEQIPLREDFSLNAGDYEAIGKNVVIANPNAPTGLALGLGEIEKIAASNPSFAVLIDEAYVDFGAESAVSLTKKYPNLIVTRTFSKSRSLAGARLGFAIANEDIISDFEKIKYSTNPYNINSLTQKIGTAAIKDRDYFEKTRSEIIKTRTFTQERLRELGFTVLDSKANFVFAKSDEISGESYYHALKQRGILVRHFCGERISDFNRITIGSPADMERLCEITKQILGKE